MTTDISRLSFRPRHNRTGVVMQQGRVQLDADWNEALEIEDRRWRSESLDILGRAYVSPQTLDAFKILNVAGALQIGRGRMYVDGLVAENHGGDPKAFDAVLAELTGTTAIPYALQPYRPKLAPAPLPVGQHMVYLDVWRRTVTYLEAPDLVEIAVGVDTTARTQTVWQVRTLQNVGGNVICTTPDGEIPGWLNTIRPSDGRLTTRNVLAPDPDDPCLLPPGAGYRGLENRSYRVEIHDQAADGTFRFKWSQVNGIIASPVVTVDSATSLTLESVARDDVLRFAAGDWVELLDDSYELEAKPGPMRRVLSVDPATRRIVLETAVAAADFPVDAQRRPDPKLHMRVRKWDQNGEVRDVGGALLADLSDPTGPGVVKVPAPGVAVRLEPGVEIEFSLADPTGRFHLGDHWIFTARTADAAIEELDKAPPLGVHHHYCRLALVESNGTAIIGEPIDCRPRPVAADCCCIAVHPGEDINAAIAALPDEGGCVCLLAGVHQLTQTVVIDRPNVTLAGEARGAILRGSGQSAVLVIGSGTREVECVRAHGFAVEGGGDALIQVAAARDVRLADLALRGDSDQPGTGVAFYKAEAVSISGSSFEQLSGGVVAFSGRDGLDVIDNTMTLTGASAGTAAAPSPTVGVFVSQWAGRSRIDSNRITGASAGVILNSRALGSGRDVSAASRITDNTIDLAAAAQDPADPQPMPAIDVGEDGCLVRGNRLTYATRANIGVRVTASHVIVAENQCLCPVEKFTDGAPFAVQVGLAEDPVTCVGVQVRDNLATGGQHGIVAHLARDLAITGNQLTPGAGLIGFGVFVSQCDGVLISENAIRRARIAITAMGGRLCTVLDNRLDEGGAGVLLSDEWRATVSRNRISSPDAFGIGMNTGMDRFEVAANRIENAGWAAETGLGVGVHQMIGELCARDNEIIDTGMASDGKMAPQALGIWGDLVLEGLIEGNLITYSKTDELDPKREDRALLMRGYAEYTVNLGGMQMVLGFPLQVLGNKFLGAGQSALVEIMGQVVNEQYRIRFERVTFSNNYCSHLVLPSGVTGTGPGGANARPATVKLNCRAAVVMGNQIKATGFNVASVDFGGAKGTFVGNVTAGGAINFADFPAPQSTFNQQIL